MRQDLKLQVIVVKNDSLKKMVANVKHEIRECEQAQLETMSI